MIADHEAQIAFEELYNKNQLVPRIYEHFASTDGVIYHFEHNEIDVKFGISLMVQMVIHKRAAVSVLVGILHKHFDTMQECADMLLVAINANVVDYSMTSGVCILRHDIPDSLAHELEIYQYPLPLLVEPGKVTKNTETGYFSELSKTGSLILKNNHTEDDICLDHLNRVNKIEYSINNLTANMVKNKWANLDKKKPTETVQDFSKRTKAFQKFNRSVKEIYDHLNVFANRFFLTNKYDKRGRVYNQAYHCNPQGNDYAKATIEFANKELIV
ncbi:MAG: hypothetical protein COA63_013930 [Methylophaga sp.]|nr:hypothetical protein [Methylophaga sp.]